MHPLTLALFALLLLGCAAPLHADPGKDAARRWAQYEPAFKKFARDDQANPPMPGGILFVGSSIFRQWDTLRDNMAPLPVLNRAFGGSRTSDQLARFSQVVLTYSPKVIVYYCGSNDLKAGDTPEDPAEIFARFKSFSDRVREKLPDTWLLFVSSTRSPDRVHRWEQVDHYNALARAHCNSTPQHQFIDINPGLVDASGHPRLDIYQDDKLHFLPMAYPEIFTPIIKPVLEQVWAAAQN
jgi:lysophospholipase L1-like esterase